MDQSKWESLLRDFRFLQTSKPLKRMLTSKSWEWTLSCKPTSSQDRETTRWHRSSLRPGITISTTISPFRRAPCNRFRLKTSVTTFRAPTTWYIISKFKWPNNPSSISRTKREWLAMPWVRTYTQTWEWTKQSLAITIKCRDITILIDKYIFLYSLFSI